MPGARAIVRKHVLTPDRLFLEQSSDANLLIGVEGLALFKQSMGFLESFTRLSGLTFREGPTELSPAPLRIVGTRRVRFERSGRMPALPIPAEDWLERE
jgi:hypothetical protein